MCACVFVVLGLVAVGWCADNDSHVFAVPRIEGLSADGAASDWGEAGFRVDIMADKRGKAIAPQDFDPKFRLAWNDDALFVLATVRDDTGVEGGGNSLYEADSVELFIADAVGSANTYQLIATPGLDPRKERQQKLFDYRQKADTMAKLKVEVAVAKTADGYVMEVALPWENLGIRPHMGMELGFQVYINDSDAEGEGPLSTIWFPRDNTSEDSSSMHRIRLGSKPTAPWTMHASMRLDDAYFKSTIVASAELAGRKVTIVHGDRTLGSAVLNEADGRSAATTRFLLPPLGEQWTAVDVLIDGKRVSFAPLPPTAFARAKATMAQEIRFDPYCFASKRLPAGDFAQPLLAERLLGPYEIDITYYDAEFNPVTTAEKVGRYGAVVKVTPAAGEPFYRFRTICRIKAGLPRWWSMDGNISLEMPSQLGFPTGAFARQGPSAEMSQKNMFRDWILETNSAAVLLAGLYETASSMATASGPRTYTRFNDAWARDRQYWVTLKRKIYGTDTRFDKPFVCPKPIGGEPAQVVREGTLAEAGMKPDAAEKIDAVCKEWGKDVDEGLAVCIVRNGVIVLHKAYGMRDGKPMTTETPSHLASVTKLFAGTTMMMLVDQGLVNLDDEADKYLPALQKAEVPIRLNIRHLYTHTSGLQGHWGDHDNDMEEILAAYYPHLPVGQRYGYNGVGLALGGKIVETITGQAVPQFYFEHLIDPLGCANTTLNGTSYDARSTPLDMAKFAQMHLNGGAYDNSRYFSEQTARKMLPPKPPIRVPGGALVDRGIGAQLTTSIKGFSDSAWGHGGGSGSGLVIDPEKKLIIATTRNSPGKNSSRHFKAYIKAIMDGIDTGQE